MLAKKLNWRDLGTSLSQVTEGKSLALLPEKRIFRCGRVDWCTQEELCGASTIVNLRVEADPPDLASAAKGKVSYVHCPIANRIEKYDATQVDVRNWITNVLNSICEATFPVVIHCAYGRDRTGIICVCLALVLGLDPEVAVREFSMTPDAPEAEIRKTLAAIAQKGGLDGYLRHKVPLDRLREVLRKG